MRFEFWLASKYLLRRETKFLKLVSVITVLGVAIGVMALLVVIAVMNGFDQELEDKILGTNSDILIKSQSFISKPDEIIAKIQGLENVVSSSSIIVGNGSLINEGYLENIYIKGIDLESEKKTTRIDNYLLNRLESISEDGIILGKIIAQKMGLGIGSSIKVLLPFNLDSFDFKVVGVFESGMYEYDSSMAYINIQKAESIFNLLGATAIEVKIEDSYKADKVKATIKSCLGSDFDVLSWMDMNRNLFSALKLEKTAMFIILCLIILVASFNIASILIMSVLEKVKDIGIMKAIGMKNATIRGVFMMQGMLIGLSGIILGSALGGGIIYLLDNYPIIKLPSDIYYIDRLPVSTSLLDFAIIIIAALAITFVATLYPAIKASKFDPVVALRYE
ncbi:MAG: ABC transporter permease [Candidatus Kaelpia aquatica]|nr:ABC transporter permease [Candidatus Kaelpia aquatica]